MMTPKEREQCIIEHYSLVRIIASRMVQRFPSHVDVDDLINTGTLGLIDAVDRYDPTRGVPFRAYAEIRIRGAIIDALRGSDWIPRAVRRRFAKLEATRGELKKSLGRPPTREEMAVALLVTPEDYDVLCEDAQIRSLVPLDAPVREDSETLLVDSIGNDEPSAPALWEAAETHAGVAAAVDQLPERERMVITLYFQQNLTLKQIGATLGVTEARVSQLKRQALERLQDRLKTSDDD